MNAQVTRISVTSSVGGVFFAAVESFRPADKEDSCDAQLSARLHRLQGVQGTDYYLTLA